MEDANPLRPWQEIASELAKETNSERLTQLAQELIRALEERPGDLKRSRAGR
jgi:hypothetical protein